MHFVRALSACAPRVERCAPLACISFHSRRRRRSVERNPPTRAPSQCRSSGPKGRFTAIPGAPREPLRRGRDLAEHVQRSPFGAGERLHGADLADLEPEDLAAAAAPRRPPPAGTAPFHATSAPPSTSSGAAYSHSTGSAATARAVTRSCAPEPVGPLLRARVNHLHVREPASRDRLLQVPAVPDRALHQRDARLGQRRRQRQARPARAGAEVGDPARARDLRSSNATSESATWRSIAASTSRTDRRRRRIGRLQLEDTPQRLDRRPAAPRTAARPARAGSRRQVRDARPRNRSIASA